MGIIPYVLPFLTNVYNLSVVNQAKYCRNSARWVAWVYSVKNLRDRKMKWSYKIWVSAFQFNSASLVYFTFSLGSPICIATRYGMDGSGIESRCVWNIPHPSRTALKPNLPPVQWVPLLFSTSKVACAWRWYPPPYSAKVKERIELWLYSTSGPLWLVLGRTLRLISLFSVVNCQICRFRESAECATETSKV